MIFLLGLLWAEQPTEIPIADQKVIHYLVDKPTGQAEESVRTSVGTDSDLPAGLQAQLQEQTKPNLQPERSQDFPELGAPWWWGLLFGALLLGVLRLFIGNKKKSLGSISVVSRSFFGHEGSVAIVEVKDAEQNPRVFLLGLHSKGSPRFLADLSAPLPFPELGDPQTTLQPSAPVQNVYPNDLVSPTRVQVEEAPEEKEEKEALVEQILRMRESKEHGEPEGKVEKRDRWSEGFHEVLRK